MTDDLFYWLADSGTTSHIMHRYDAFTTYEPIKHIPISGIGGIRTHAIGKGTVVLYSEYKGYVHTLHLNNVLHVPNNKNNLFLIGCWEEQLRWQEARYNSMNLYSANGTTIAKGRKLSNKLYKIPFKLDPLPANMTVANAKGESKIQSANATTIPWEVWHKHFGHISYTGLQNLLCLDLVDGLNVDTQSPKPDCVACTEAKLLRSPYGPTSGRETEPGKIMHTNLWGKYDIASINSNRYYLLLVDDATQYVAIHFLKQKSQAAQKVIEYIAYLKAQGKSPCGIQMDCGTEFVNTSLQNLCNVQGIDLQMTAPYLPSQNGVAKHMNRMLEELARAMLTGEKLPEFLWELTIGHATYLWNLSYTTALPTATPYRAWHGQKPNVSHLCEFGTPVWILLQGQHVQ